MFITSLCDLLPGDIASFASRDEGPVSLSSETNISVKSETVYPVQKFLMCIKGVMEQPII